MVNKRLNDEQRDLITNNFYMAHKVAYEYANQNRQTLEVKHLTSDDIVQIALEEMCHSAMRYKKESGKFSTYAMQCMRLKIRQRVDSMNQIKIPHRQNWTTSVNKDHESDLKLISTFGLSSLNMNLVNSEGDTTEMSDLIEDEKNDYEKSELIIFLENILNEIQLEALYMYAQGNSKMAVAMAIEKKYDKTYTYGMKSINDAIEITKHRYNKDYVVARMYG